MTIITNESTKNEDTFLSTDVNINALEYFTHKIKREKFDIIKSDPPNDEMLPGNRKRKDLDEKEMAKKI